MNTNPTPHRCETCDSCKLPRTVCANGDEIVRYCLVTPLRNIVFYNSDIKSIREERYGN